MDLSREPLRLDKALTVEELDDLTPTSLRLVSEDEFALTPLRLLGEARRRPGLAGSFAQGFNRGFSGAPAAPAAPAPAAGPGFFSRAISGYKGQKSGEGTMAHHLGQWLSPHQSALGQLKKDTELAQARTGLAKASGQHQKATRGFIAANQSRQKQLARGRTTAGPPPGGPAGGAAPPSPPATPPTPPAPPAGGGTPPAGPAPAPAPGGTPVVRKVSPPPTAASPPVATPATPAPGASPAPKATPVSPPPLPPMPPKPPGMAPVPPPMQQPPSSKGAPGPDAKKEAAKAEIKAHIQKNKGAGREGVHAIMQKHFGADTDTGGSDQVYKNFHKEVHGEPPPDAEMSRPHGAAPAQPAAQAPAPAKKAPGKPIPPKAIGDVMKSGGDTLGKLTALHAVHGHDVNDPEVKKNIADLHGHAQKLHAPAPEAPKPAGEAPKPAEAPKAAEPAKAPEAKPEGPNPTGFIQAASKHMLAGGHPDEIHKIAADHGLNANDPTHAQHINKIHDFAKKMHALKQNDPAKHAVLAGQGKGAAPQPTAAPGTKKTLTPADKTAYLDATQKAREANAKDDTQGLDAAVADQGKILAGYKGGNTEAKPGEPAKASPGKPAGYNTSWVSKGGAPSWAGKKPESSGMFGKGTKPGKPKPDDAPAAEPEAPEPPASTKQSHATAEAPKAETPAEPAPTKVAPKSEAPKPAPSSLAAPTKAAPPSSGGEGGGRGAGRPNERNSTPVDKGQDCKDGETKASGPNVDGTSYCVKKQGGTEGRGEGAAPAKKEDIYDLIGDLNVLTANLP